jgi:asparagine synthase (glutamine-hydrolysing)
MGAWQVHRGPDAWGQYVADGIALGHNRLSIVDLSGGAQPMGSADGQVWVVFNGEIYNHRQLREELIGKGHTFVSDHSDTETILVGYREWGREVFTRLDGMFALAIWDARNHELVLARDRVGIKPLCYAELPDNQLLFSSELKALLGSGLVERSFDPDLLPEFLTFRTTGERCFVRGVKRLPPACYLVYSSRNGSSGPIRYWSSNPPPDHGLSHAARLERLHGVLEDAVQSHLIADVPLGLYLSGGVDSSLLAALARKALPVAGYTIGTESKLSEVPFARAVSAATDMPLYERSVEPSDFLQNFDLWAFYNDDPISDPSALALMLLTQHARARGMKVMLSGEGADELFGGYNAYLRFWLIAQTFRFVPRGARKLLGKRMGGRWEDYLCGTPDLRFFGSGHVGSVRLKRTLLLPEVVSRGGDLHHRVSFPIASHAPNVLRHAMRWDRELRLPYDVLARTDRATMAFSVEGRVPFLDRRVIEFADALPDSECVDPTRMACKPLLKELAATLVPPSVIYRRKRGFDLPVGQWLRSRFLDLGRTFIAERQVPGLDYLGIEQVWGRHVRAQQDQSASLWAWLVLEQWYRSWLLGRAELQRPQVAADPTTSQLLKDNAKGFR